jgi:predicted nucleic acid-binding protein
VAESIVIDASVAIALVRHEPRRPAIWAATRSWATARIRLLVPSIFWVEVVNALVRKHHRAETEVVEALATLDELAIETIELDRPTLLLALVPMSEAGLSAYDALYLALAISTESRLATLDRRLAEVAGSRAVLFVEGGPGRLAEPPAPYERDAGRAPAWVRSAAVGAHIAELRRRAIAAGG